MNIDTALFSNGAPATQKSRAPATNPSGSAAASAEQKPAPAPAPAQPTAPPPSVETVRAAAAQIESYLKSSNRSLEFRVDNASGTLVVKVLDSETGDTIRQIPSEEALRLARSLGEKLSPGSDASGLIDLSV